MKGEKTVPYILVWDIIILVYNDKKAHDTEVTWHDIKEHVNCIATIWYTHGACMDNV